MRGINCVKSTMVQIHLQNYRALYNSFKAYCLVVWALSYQFETARYGDWQTDRHAEGNYVGVMYLKIYIICININNNAMLISKILFWSDNTLRMN